LKPEAIIESFEAVASGEIPKEAVEIIFESIMSGKSRSYREQPFIRSVKDLDELDETLDKIIQNNMDLVKERGERAVVTLMGIAMKEVRGRYSGQLVNELLRKKVSKL
jgi:glutamyl-tRNA(Gln) amidotransferase subunit E